MKRLVATAIKLILAWFPFFVLWTAFIMSYSNEGLGNAAITGGVHIGSAAVLGVGVWSLSGRYPWPDHVRGSFYALHLFTGSLYAVLWMGISYFVASLRLGRSIVALVAQSEILGWQFTTGLWLYGLVAGVSYALRTRDRLREQERVAARAEALAVRAQMQALRARLNPHFLFNALHSLSALIRHDPAAAERAVERLGDLLRYTLDESGEEEVQLADDWEFTQHYLDLERLRLNSRLRVCIDIETGALACLVPSFTLQPLVENAVQHAIAPRPEGGRIEVEARLRNGQLVLTVRDDGPGARAEAIPAASGLGLRTLRQRLHALYGDAAQLAVSTTPGEGFSVTVVVPTEPKDGLVAPVEESGELT